MGNLNGKQIRKYLSRILLKAKQFIICAILCNVQDGVSFFRILKNEEK